MVQKAHVDQRQRRAQALGKGQVGSAGVQAAAGVVVGENHRGGVVVQRAAGERPELNGMFGHAAAPHFFAGEQAVLRVEKQRGADFDPFATDAQAQKLGGFLR